MPTPSLHPAHLPRAAARQHAGGVADLGDQHDLPARRRALEPRGVRGQRLLHRRDGAVRGADRDRRRHRRPPGLVPARHADADRVDAALRAAVAGRGAVLAVGGRLAPARSRVHVLLRRGRGVAGRRAHRDGLHRRAGVGVRARPGRHRSGDAHRLGRGRVHRPADQPGRAVRAPRRDPRRDVRGRVQAHARRRVHPREGRSAAGRDAEDRLRVDRLRLAGPRGQVADGRVAVHGRRRHLRLLRPAAVPARALRRPARPTRSPAWWRRSSPARRSSAGSRRRGSAGSSTAAPRR